MTWLLDTNVVSEWVKPRPAPGVIEWLAAVDEDRVHLSVCTIAELERGIELLPAGRRRTALRAWLDDELLERFRDRVLAVDSSVASAWGRLSAVAQRSGRSLAAMDGLIAATAAVHDLTVVTRKTRDFRGLDVDLFDPWTDAMSLASNQ